MYSALIFFYILFDLVLCEPTEEYSILCQYLALPSTPGDLFTEDILQIVGSRIGDVAIKQRAAQGSELLNPVVQFPHSVNQLIELPEDYSDLINSASKFT